MPRPTRAPKKAASPKRESSLPRPTRPIDPKPQRPGGAINVLPPGSAPLTGPYEAKVEPSVPVESRFYGLDGTEKPLLPKDGVSFTANELREIVGGDYAVAALPKMGTAVMVRQSRKGDITGLPINIAAGTIWTRNFDGADVITGNVLICDAKAIK
jgi:hypothetical protein